MAVAASVCGASAPRTCRDILINSSCARITPDEEDPSGESSAAVGQAVGCRIWVANHGECDLTGARVVNALPSGVRFLDAVPSPAVASNQEIAWQGDILMDRSYRLDLAFRVREPANRLITNTACLMHPAIETVCASWNLWIEGEQRE